MVITHNEVVKSYMENITYFNDELLTISNRDELFDISMNMDESQLRNIDEFVMFVKACEKTIRHMDEYKTFKAQLYEMGLTRCQIWGNIDMGIEGDGVDIEMHHGPILTLFDYCAIMIDHLLRNGEMVTTFDIARKVLDEHWEGNVQVVMLSKTVHQLVDTGQIFINFNQATGNINRFLKKYRDGLNPERIEKINKYIQMSEQFDSFDNGLLDIKNTITDWNYEVALERMKQPL